MLSCIAFLCFCGVCVHLSCALDYPSLLMCVAVLAREAHEAMLVASVDAAVAAHASAPSAAGDAPPAPPSPHEDDHASQ